jgi:hypothetical protein
VKGSKAPTRYIAADLQNHIFFLEAVYLFWVWYIKAKRCTMLNLVAPMKKIFLPLFILHALLAFACSSSSSPSSETQESQATETTTASSPQAKQEPNASGKMTYSFDGKNFEAEVDQYFRIYKDKKIHENTGKEFHQFSFTIYDGDRVIRCRVAHNGLASKFDGDYPLMQSGYAQELTAYCHMVFTDTNGNMDNTFMPEQGVAKVFMDGKTLKVTIAQAQGRMMLNSRMFPVAYNIEVKNYRLSEE